MLAPIVLPIIVVVVMILVFVPLIRRTMGNAKLLKSGAPGMARVLRASQTGVTVNDRPQMRIELEVIQGGPPRQATAVQILDLGSIPRPGDIVNIVYDPADLSKARLTSGVVADTFANLPPAFANMAAQALAGQAQAMAAFQTMGGSTAGAAQAPTPPPALKGELGVGEVISTSSITGSPVVSLELDAIGAPKRRVTADAIPGQSLDAGDRVYVQIDPNDRSAVTILPPSMTGGQTLPRGMNRLDALVLGPQILKAGAKAKAVVKAAEHIAMGEPVLAARGFSKWKLELEVTPERGWPYRTELTTSLSSPEKAARIAHVGAEFPVRYDPEDQKTVAIDSIALGYGDPYESIKSMVNFAN